MNYLRQTEQPERPPVLPKEMICLPRERKRVRFKKREGQKDKVLLTCAFWTQTRSSCKLLFPVLQILSHTRTHWLPFTHTLIHQYSHTYTHCEELSIIWSTLTATGKIIHKLFIFEKSHIYAGSDVFICFYSDAPL